MAYYIKEQTKGNNSTEFSIIDLTEFDIYSDKADLLNDIQEFNSGFEKVGELRYKNGNLEVLLGEVLSVDEIQDILIELGETGGYKVIQNELHMRKQENCSWQYCGNVVSRSQVDKAFQSVILD